MLPAATVADESEARLRVGPCGQDARGREPFSLSFLFSLPFLYQLERLMAERDVAAARRSYRVRWG